jgi:hypothetical protein
MSAFDRKDNDVPTGPNIRPYASRLKGRVLLVLYVVVSLVAMAGWIWFLEWTGIRFVKWLLN